ncbi:transposase [Clostridium sp. 'deep sea']|uniref:transposase n=1 Tax=Clostridium sp. 'deep sea' TaxID=2779445 RepID=UPI00325FC226
MKQEYYNQFFKKGQLKINFKLSEIGLPANDPVYTLIKILEELNYTSLLARYKNRGRKGYNPIMMYAVMVYANMQGVSSVDKIVELCERDIVYISLTKGRLQSEMLFISSSIIN